MAYTMAYMQTETSQKRCEWANGHELLTIYHDEEWGDPVHDDRLLFELLNLEVAQAGLNWLTILKKRAAYHAAFDDFDAAKIARYSEAKQQELLQDAGIVRHRQKINAFIENARTLHIIQEKYGSFDKYVWEFVDNISLVRPDEQTGVELSKRLSKDLKKHGFCFVGPTTCYAFMQAVGMIDDHEPSCFKTAA